MEKLTDIISSSIEGALLDKRKADARSHQENRNSGDSLQDSIRLNGSIGTKIGLCCHYCHDYYFECILGQENRINRMRANAIKQDVSKHGHCEFCGGFENKEEFGVHLMRKHPEMYFQCFWCQEYYRTETQLGEHVKNHPDTHQNHIIGSTQVRNSLLTSKRNNADEKDKENSLRLGKINPVRPYGCTECRSKLKSYENMCRHRRLKHNSFAGKKISKRAFARLTKEQEEMNFYRNVRSNVAENLEHYLDGKDVSIFAVQSKKQNTDPIDSDEKENLNCSLYNFDLSMYEV